MEKEAFNAERALNLHNKISLDDVSAIYAIIVIIIVLLGVYWLFLLPPIPCRAFFPILWLKMDQKLNGMRVNCMCTNITKQLDWFLFFGSFSTLFEEKKLKSETRQKVQRNKQKIEFSSILIIYSYAKESVYSSMEGKNKRCHYSKCT